MGKTKDVRAAVEAELGFDPLVNSADIKVMNLGGDVTLYRLRHACRAARQ